MEAPLPADEEARLGVLAGCAILDTDAEPWFDDIVALAREVCDVPIALVSLVDRDRQWFKARVGIEHAETPREMSFCAHAILEPVPLVIPDTHADPRFADNPSVTGPPYVRFYAGVPIRVRGKAIGTLCVAAPTPRQLSPRKLVALTALARRVESEVQLRGRLPTKPDTAEARASAERDGGHGPLDAGDRVADRYRVLASIGGGGMGRVYRAHDETTNTDVALKVLVAALVSEELVERFAREGRALLKVDDPHVAKIFDAGNLDDGTPFLAMELLEGYDLGARPERTLPVREAAELVRQAALGASAAHVQGIVHRDLKPSNIFVVTDPSGAKTVKLLDFGVSKLKEGDDAGGSVDPRLTRDAAVIGSPLYMSPEQMLSSRGVDARSDIWALGVILQELLTGEHPFDGETITEICSNVFTREPRAPSTMRAGIPDGLDAIIAKALAFTPPNRYPNARAFAQALAPFAK